VYIGISERDSFILEHLMQCNVKTYRVCGKTLVAYNAIRHSKLQSIICTQGGAAMQTT